MCHLGIVDFYWPLRVRRRKLVKVFIGCRVTAVALSWSGGRSLQWQDKAETLMVCLAETPLYGNVIGFVLSDSLLTLVYESSLGETQGTRVWHNWPMRIPSGSVYLETQSENIMQVKTFGFEIHPPNNERLFGLTESQWNLPIPAVEGHICSVFEFLWYEL